ncbi:hypothetical protein GCM10009090_11680 [[Pseudomonas] boreopolis]|uniref:Integrase n=1 Tax=Xanthomonas boreopolis TaxID=86183 RepID=A0A919F755_9XANT|nr:hypothetical protein GCM10009090_11680 [[Pseudomonas] boreopolis]
MRDEARALLAKGINPHTDRKQKRHAVKLAADYTFKARWMRPALTSPFVLRGCQRWQKRKSLPPSSLCPLKPLCRLWWQLPSS